MFNHKKRLGVGRCGGDNLSAMIKLCISLCIVMGVMLISSSAAWAAEPDIPLSTREWQQIKAQILWTEQLADGFIDDMPDSDQRSESGADTSVSTTLLQSDYIKPFNTDAADNFGFTLAISGSTLVVGSPNEDSNGSGTDGNSSSNNLSNSGAVYVFERTENGWIQEAYLKASNPDANDQFGFDVDIDGDRLVVGATGEDGSGTGVNPINNNAASRSGAAYIFVREGGEWIEQAYLKAFNTSANDQFGHAVAISLDTVVIGAIAEDNSGGGINPPDNNSSVDVGAAYVFVDNNGSWSQQAYLKPTNPDRNDNFGFSVAASGNTVIVGSPNEDSNSNVINGSQGNLSGSINQNFGAAYVYQRNGSQWAQQAYLKAPVPTSNDQYGRSVAISNDLIVVGAPFEDSNAVGVGGDLFNDIARESGAAYVYQRNGNGDWRYFEFLKASNTGSSDNFANSVDVMNNFILVGAHLEDSNNNTTGMNNNDSPSAGAAYLYLLDNNTITTNAFIKAQNAQGTDEFGSAVGLSSLGLVVSAQNEDSSTNVINGDQNNNDALSSGAAYFFSQGSSFHPVGGVILGLVEGNSVTLLNNEGDALEVAENGRFRFAPLYVDGDVYAVTVAPEGQPTSPRQDCTISNAEGTVNGNAIDNIIVDCSLRTLAIANDVNTVESAIVSVPIQLAPEGLALAGVSFALDYDPTCINPDRDEDGQLDNLVFNVSDDFTTTVLFDPTDLDGEIFISIADFSPPFSTLTTADVLMVDFFVECPAARPFFRTNIRFGDNPPPSFSNLVGQDVEGTTSQGSVRVWDGISGDCNVTGDITVADVISVGLEVTDDDGDGFIDAPESEFFGSPQGCDANGNEVITAADAVCVNLLLAGENCAPLRLTNARQPELNVSTELDTDMVWIQTRLTHHEGGVAGISYTLDLDLSEFDISLIDLDGNGIPDNLRYAQGQPGFAQVLWKEAEDRGQLQVILLDTAQNLLAQGLVLEVGIPTAQVPEQGIEFNTQRLPVFADTSGNDVPGLFNVGDVIFRDTFE